MLRSPMYGNWSQYADIQVSLSNMCILFTFLQTGPACTAVTYHRVAKEAHNQLLLTELISIDYIIP